MDARPILLALVVFMGAVSCSSDDDDPPDPPLGSVGATCYPNGTCNLGLRCDDGVCVPEDSHACGNGAIDPGETCDTGIASGTEACPSTCNDFMPCTVDTLVGTDCTARCTNEPITVPVDGDGCCASNDTAATDADCPAECGNAVLEPGETCDIAIASGAGTCPTTCADSDACTSDTLGGGGTCQATCENAPITVPASGDGCCPTGANANDDNDCMPICGNTIPEPPEQCDDGNATNTDGCDNACNRVDLSCLETARAATANPTVQLSGTASELVMTGTTAQIQSLANAVIATCVGDCAGPNLRDTTSSGSGGEFATSPLGTGGAPLDAYLRITKTSYRPTLLYPATPATADVMGLVSISMTSATFSALTASLGVAQSASNGAIFATVIDCAGRPIANTALVRLSLRQAGDELTGTTVVDLGTVSSSARGTFAIFNVPPGQAVLSADFDGARWSSRAVLVEAGVTTLASVRPGGDIVRVQDVQNDTTAVGTRVKLRGAVVTAIDRYGARTDDVWLQQPGGGAYSGVRVFGLTPAQTAALTVGDAVDVDGAIKREFALPTDTSGRTATELGSDAGALSITIRTSGNAVSVAIVDPLAIGRLPTQAARDAEWHKWEGVLVSVREVRELSAPRQLGSDQTLAVFDVTGRLRVASALAAFPTGLDTDTCLSAVTGVLDYLFTYQLLPRASAEVSTGGTACPAPETTASACGDGVDNDANGFADCADNACVIGTSACRTLATIPAIQSGATTGAVELADVFVTAVSSNRRNFWVASNLTAAANEGIYVFGNSDVLDPSIASGARVTVIGRAVEFNDASGTGTLTEIELLQATVTSAPAGSPMPVTGQTATTLVTDSAGEPFESVLVRLQNVRVHASGDASGVGQLSQNGTAVLSDDDIFAIPSTEIGKCYASLTGIWTYQVFRNAWALLPVGPGSGTGTCP